MYRVGAFEITEISELHRLIRSLELAQLVTKHDDGFLASAIPFILDDASSELGILHGHLARGNPQWRAIEPGTQAMAIFTGPHAYISPSYYATLPSNPKAVPTWDYVTVNVHGFLTVHDDPSWAANAVDELTSYYEHGRAQPWSMSDAPPDYVKSRLKSIVGIELAITKIEGKAKLSQNRPERDQQSVVDALSSGTVLEQEVAELMINTTTLS